MRSNRVRLLMGEISIAQLAVGGLWSYARNHRSAVMNAAMRLRVVGLGLVLACEVVIAAAGCSVSGRCYSSSDCTPPRICDRAEGRCAYECSSDDDCEGALRCRKRRCVPHGKGADDGAASGLSRLDCPDDMVNIGDSFCIDRYEASRPDATETDEGEDESQATSRRGVLPWTVGDENAEARAACLAAGKDLCTELEWQLACRGTRGSSYGYGNIYEEKTCNGIDLFGVGNHKLLPTGSLPRCHSDYGVYDLNGNLWEHVLGGTGATVRGGAYDCGDSQQLHRCGYVPISWTPLSLGFRCCRGRERVRGG